MESLDSGALILLQSITSHKDGGVFCASQEPQGYTGFRESRLSLNEARTRLDCILQVVRKDEFVGLRCLATGGKFLQARRKLHPFGFASNLFGTWEQWEVSTMPSEEDEGVVLAFQNRRLPTTQLIARVHWCLSTTPSSPQKTPGSPQHHQQQQQEQEEITDPPTPHLRWPSSLVSPGQQAATPFTQTQLHSHTATHTPLHTTHTPSHAHSPARASPVPFNMSAALEQGPVSPYALEHVPKNSPYAFTSPSSLLTPPMPPQPKNHMHPTPALPSRQIAFTPELSSEGRAMGSRYMTPDPQPWPLTTPRSQQHTPITPKGSPHRQSNPQHTPITPKSSPHRQSNPHSLHPASPTPSHSSAPPSNSSTPYRSATPQSHSNTSTPLRSAPHPHHANSHTPLPYTTLSSLSRQRTPLPYTTPGSSLHTPLSYTSLIGQHTPLSYASLIGQHTPLSYSTLTGQHTPLPYSTLLPHTPPHYTPTATASVSESPLLYPSSVHHAHRRRRPQQQQQQPVLEQQQQPLFEQQSVQQQQPSHHQQEQQPSHEQVIEQQQQQPPVQQQQSFAQQSHPFDQQQSPLRLPNLLSPPSSSSTSSDSQGNGNEMVLLPEKLSHTEQPLVVADRGSWGGIERSYHSSSYEDEWGYGYEEDSQQQIVSVTDLQDDVLDLSTRMVRGFVSRVSKAPLYIVFKLWSGWARRAVERGHTARQHCTHTTLHRAWRGWKCHSEHRQYKLSRGRDADSLHARLLHSRLVRVLMAWLRVAVRRAAQARAVSHMQRIRGFRTQSKVFQALGDAVRDAWQQGERAAGIHHWFLVRAAWVTWHVYLQSTYAVNATADAMQWSRQRHQATLGLVAWRQWASQRRQLRSKGDTLHAEIAARALSKAWGAWQAQHSNAVAMRTVAACMKCEKDEQLVKEVLLEWAEHTQEQKIWKGEQTHRSLLRCFRSWHHRVDVAKTALQFAEGLRKKRDLQERRAVFLSWLQLTATTTAYAASIARHMAAKRTASLQRDAFCCWREAAQDVWRERVDWMLLCRVFLSWAAQTRDSKQCNRSDLRQQFLPSSPPLSISFGQPPSSPPSNAPSNLFGQTHAQPLPHSNLFRQPSSQLPPHTLFGQPPSSPPSQHPLPSNTPLSSQTIQSTQSPWPALDQHSISTWHHIQPSTTSAASLHPRHAHTPTRHRSQPSTGSAASLHAGLIHSPPWQHPLTADNVPHAMLPHTTLPPQHQQAHPDAHMLSSHNHLHEQQHQQQGHFNAQQHQQQQHHTPSSSGGSCSLGSSSSSACSSVARDGQSASNNHALQRRHSRKRGCGEDAPKAQTQAQQSSDQQAGSVHSNEHITDGRSNAHQAASVLPASLLQPLQQLQQGLRGLHNNQSTQELSTGVSNTVSQSQSISLFGHDQQQHSSQAKHSGSQQQSEEVQSGVSHSMAGAGEQQLVAVSEQQRLAVASEQHQQQQQRGLPQIVQRAGAGGVAITYIVMNSADHEASGQPKTQAHVPAVPLLCGSSVSSEAAVPPANDSVSAASERVHAAAVTSASERVPAASERLHTAPAPAPLEFSNSDQASSVTSGVNDSAAQGVTNSVAGKSPKRVIPGLEELSRLVVAAASGKHASNQPASDQPIATTSSASQQPAAPRTAPANTSAISQPEAPAQSTNTTGPSTAPDQSTASEQPSPHTAQQLKSRLLLRAASMCGPAALAAVTQLCNSQQDALKASRTQERQRLLDSAMQLERVQASQASSEGSMDVIAGVQNEAARAEREGQSVYDGHKGGQLQLGWTNDLVERSAETEKASDQVACDASAQHSSSTHWGSGDTQAGGVAIGDSDSATVAGREGDLDKQINSSLSSCASPLPISAASCAAAVAAANAAAAASAALASSGSAGTSRDTATETDDDFGGNTATSSYSSHTSPAPLITSSSHDTQSSLSQPQHHLITSSSHDTQPSLSQPHTQSSLSQPQHHHHYYYHPLPSSSQQQQQAHKQFPPPSAVVNVPTTLAQLPTQHQHSIALPQQQHSSTAPQPHTQQPLQQNTEQHNQPPLHQHNPTATQQNLTLQHLQTTLSQLEAASWFRAQGAAVARARMAHKSSPVRPLLSQTTHPSNPTSALPSQSTRPSIPTPTLSRPQQQQQQQTPSQHAISQSTSRDQPTTRDHRIAGSSLSAAELATQFHQMLKGAGPLTSPPLADIARRRLATEQTQQQHSPLQATALQHQRPQQHSAQKAAHQSGLAGHATLVYPGVVSRLGVPRKSEVPDVAVGVSRDQGIGKLGGRLGATSEAARLTKDQGIGSGLGAKREAAMRAELEQLYALLEKKKAEQRQEQQKQGGGKEKRQTIRSGLVRKSYRQPSAQEWQ